MLKYFFKEFSVSLLLAVILKSFVLNILFTNVSLLIFNVLIVILARCLQVNKRYPEKKITSDQKITLPRVSDKNTASVSLTSFLFV